MRFFLIYLATISTAIAGPVVDLWLDASSLGSSASQGSGADVPEAELHSISGPDTLDTAMLPLANSGSVIGNQPPNPDLNAPDPGTEVLHQGDLATIEFLRPFLPVPLCEILFKNKKPYCCDEKCCDDSRLMKNSQREVKGCDHWIRRVNTPGDEGCDAPEYVYCCGSWDWMTRIAYGCVSAFYDEYGIWRIVQPMSIRF